jgi:pimeloyl-ACP methyl ester carboxylesterase
MSDLFDNSSSLPRSREILIPPRGLPGTLIVPDAARGLVLFAHGSGSSRFSPRNRQVAEGLNSRRIATLLFDLLMLGEDSDRRNVFNIDLLARRLMDAVEWALSQPEIATQPIGLFGASTGAAAALVTAAAFGGRIAAVVSRGGRPDLADLALPRVAAPTLLIVGGADDGVIELNQRAFAQLACSKRLEIVPGATHLFPEPGALETVIDLAGTWFERQFAAKGSKVRA